MSWYIPSPEIAGLPAMLVLVIPHNPALALHKNRPPDIPFLFGYSYRPEFRYGEWLDRLARGNWPPSGPRQIPPSSTLLGE